MILVKKNMDQKAKKCSASLTELPRNNIIIFLHTSVVSFFSVHAALALARINRIKLLNESLSYYIGLGSVRVREMG
jgi:hypothetical protein